ncbi:DinB family protein [Brevibacterium sanguinis]|uniref:DinB family protein n=2 Tax=Brevibacterium TaxID=1696 RepID=A0A366IM47_9MICO|nr:MULTISPECIES: DinB family protein [Brevibacterium]RBP67282.1 DinB family protein [Brevibacterium sanguinis]RBP73807.1 DinB family protein [Brevibacterium celere]
MTNEIAPDTKDWAEVLDEGCAECGFTGREDPTGVAATVRESVPRWARVLGRSDVRERSRPGRWSDLEYAAHMRDILTLFRDRTRLILTEEHPELPKFDGDPVAVDSDYRSQDPAVVRTDLGDAAADYADVLSRIDGEQWARTGRRADGRVFTLTGLTLYGLHEVRHHLGDVDG